MEMKSPDTDTATLAVSADVTCEAITAPAKNLDALR